ncbi:MAG: hypothetical protein WBB17_07755 [Saprospiraceae bacterium]
MKKTLIQTILFMTIMNINSSYSQNDNIQIPTNYSSVQNGVNQIANYNSTYFFAEIKNNKFISINGKNTNIRKNINVKFKTADLNAAGITINGSIPNKKKDNKIDKASTSEKVSKPMCIYCKLGPCKPGELSEVAGKCVYDCEFRVCTNPN